MMLGHKAFGVGPCNVLALHGWMGNEHTFDPLLPALSPDEFTIIAPAFRGYGASKTLAGRFDVDEAADDVVSLCESLGWKKLSLVGHSMGALVAQRILFDSRITIEKLVAITPVPACGVKFDEGTLRLFEAATTDFESCCGIVNFATGNRLSRAWIEAAARVSLETATPEAKLRFLKSWTSSDFSKEIAGNKTPILAIIGEFDPAQTEEFMRGTFLTWYPNCELEIFKNAGHCAIDETPLIMASRVRQFLLCAPNA